MILGNKSEYAIEVMLEPGLKPPSHVWGRMCLWFGENKIGDFDEPHCSLAQSLSALNDLAGRLEKLWDVSFEGLNDLEIFELLNKAVHSQRSSSYDLDRDYEKYADYRFTYGLAEMFDRTGASFIVKPPHDRIKVMYLDPGSGGLEIFKFSADLFRQTTLEFEEWFEEQSRLMGSEYA